MQRDRKRVDIKAILRDPYKRRELMVDTIIATQAREGVTTTRAQAEAAYDKVEWEKAHYTRKQRAEVSPKKPLRAPAGYRQFAEVFATDTLLDRPKMRALLKRLGVTRSDKQAIVKILVEAWLNGWINANAERDDLATSYLEYLEP